MEHFLVEHFKELFLQNNNFVDLHYNPPGENLKGVSRFYLNDTHAPIINSYLKEDINQKQIYSRVIKLLKYKPGSFASEHHDGEQIDWTSITLIDKPDDLLGGECIIKGVPHELDIGETVWYPGGMLHGVNELRRGYRNVLVVLWSSLSAET